MTKPINTEDLTLLKTAAGSINEKVKSVAVLYGGTSGEREVSIASGISAKKVLENDGFDVAFIDTCSENFIGEILEFKPDAAFLALHGAGGEDGCIQGFLETLAIPYTHSGVAGSALAMDKEVSKIMYKDAGLKTAEYFTLSKKEVLAQRNTDDLTSAVAGSIDSIIEHIGLPCVVKTICDGSSIGVYIPKERADLINALIAGFEIDDTLMIEEYISGVEVTVAVLGNACDSLVVLPVIEIIANSEFYDYEAKYAEGGSTHVIPARISKAATEACINAAKLAHIKLRCSGVSRTDMIITADSVPYLIETNTVPGMTETSLVPETARSYGLSTEELYRLLLYYALEKSL